MATQRFTIRLTQLRCITESDAGPSEPYIWVTYFALGPPVPAFQTGPLAQYTPAYDAFRGEFANNVSAGSVVGIPSFIASASFDMDLDTPGPKLLGCVVILMEEDETRHDDIVRGSIAYSKEMEKQLNALINKRIQMGDRGPLTEAEKEDIKAAVKSKVTDAIGSHQSFWDLFRDQDDALGFTYKVLPDDIDGTIEAQAFDFPEIIRKSALVRSSSGYVTTDRYVLSGEVTVATIPQDPIDLCAPQRAALAAKKQEIHGLQGRRDALQLQLQHAAPQQKAVIIHEITETNAEITTAEAQLPAVEAALTACMNRFRHDHVVPHEGLVVNPGG